MTPEDLRATPNPLAAHYTRFGVDRRLLLTGHSHQAWPDVALDGQLAAFADAAMEVDAKWDKAFAQAERVRAGFRQWLADPGDLALGASTHELVIRLLSALDLVARPRIVTTDGEFHTLRRQLARLGEAGVDVVNIPAEPVDTLAERLADEVDSRTCAVFVSAVLFETSRIVPGLAALADRCVTRGAELVVDAYHALGAMPFPLAPLGLTSAWVLGGGYKYVELGEGNCFLRLPEHAADLRPVITGWYAEFAALADPAHPERVSYGPGSQRFAGATYDPTSHYRAARVFDFFAEHGLTPEVLRASYLHQTEVLASRFDELDLPPELISRPDHRPRTDFGGFLALRSPQASRLQAALKTRGLHTDSRGEHLRLGPAPYLSDAQLASAISVLADTVREFG